MKYILSAAIILICFIAEFVADPLGNKVFALTLPLTYIIVYVLFIDIFKFKNILVGQIVNLLLFVRLVILPICIILDDTYMDEIPFNIGLPNSYYFKYGVSLMLYEVTFIGLYLKYRFSHFSNSLKGYDKVNYRSLYKYDSNAVIIVSLFILMLIFSYNPSAWGDRTLVFSLEEDSAIEYYEKVDSGRSFSDVLSSLAMRYITILLPIPLITIFYKRYICNRNIFNSLVLIILMLGSYGLFIEGASRVSLLVPILMSYFVAVNLMPERRVMINIFVLSFFIIITAVVTYWKMYTTRGINDAPIDLSQLVWTLELYFVGIGNMGKILVAKMELEEYTSINYLVNDLFYSFPILSHYINPDETTTKIFQNVFYGRTDQVVPAIGNGLFSFGYVLCPLVTIFQLELSLWFEKYAKKSKTIGKQMIFIYATIMLAYGCFSSVSIFIQKLVIPVSVIAIIVSINEYYNVYVKNH